MKENINAGMLIGAICIGLLVGYVFGNSNARSNTLDGMAHRMPDGSMMMNDHAHSAMEDAMHDMTGALKGKTGDAFDQEFLTQMIVHHEGAVEMAEMVLTQSSRPELQTLAQEIIDAQTREIDMMRTWQNTWGLSEQNAHMIGRPVPPAPPMMPPVDDGMVACTMEARECPDGSYVGRQGPNCEFAKCPGQ